MSQRAPALIREMLSRTGAFRTLPASAGEQSALAEGWKASSIAFDAWTARGAFALVKGTFRATRRGLLLELHTYDVETGTRIRTPSDRMLITDNSFQRALELWTNAVVDHFTGRPGVLGTRIVFARRPREPRTNKRIAVMDLASGEEFAITDGKKLSVLPSWGPGSHDVAYTGYQDGNPDLFLGDQKFAGFPNLNMGAEWNQDGSLCAISLSKDGNSEIYLLDGTSGAVIRRLTSHSAIDSSPSWSPDGKRIAFVSDRSGSPQVHVMNIWGGNIRRVTQGHGYATSPAWSPHGNEIVYNAMMEGGRFDLFIINEQSRRVRRLTSGGGSNEDPSWSPDGRQIVFSSARKDRTGKTSRQLYILGARGGTPKKISGGKVDYFTPSWSTR
jgi:TolB protein